MHETSFNTVSRECALTILRRSTYSRSWTHIHCHVLKIWSIKYPNTKCFPTFDLTSAYHQIPLRESETKFTAFEALGDLYEFVVLPFGVTNGVPSFQRIINNVVTQEGLKNTFPYLDNVTVAGFDQDDHDKNVAAFLEMIKRRNITLNASKSVLSVPVIDYPGYQTLPKKKLRVWYSATKTSSWCKIPGRSLAHSTDWNQGSGTLESDSMVG